MPTVTFDKLSQEKKDKIINAAKKEFARVVFSETSIKNIVEEAGISRGSFYQYFESKEDLLKYILKQKVKIRKDSFEKMLNDYDGDIFNIFIKVFEQAISGEFSKEDLKMMKMIFNHIRICDEKIIPIEDFNNKECGTNQENCYNNFIKKIDLSKLKVDNKKDLVILLKMINGYTKKSIYQYYGFEDIKDKEKVKEEFYRAIKLIENAFIIK